jgi:prepilin-type N-terminal cleavage/methylation domain-containing protein
MDTRLIHRSQRGFTLIELLIAIGITAIITGVLTASIMQVWTVSYRTRDRMTAVRQVQQAGFWVSPDVMTAQTVTPGGGPDPFLTLNWTVNNNKYGIVYSLEGTGTLKTLQRNYYVNSNLDSTIVVAEYIDPDQTRIRPGQACSFPHCGAYNFTVTATVGDQSETRTYEVKPRPGPY